MFLLKVSPEVLGEFKSKLKECGKDTCLKLIMKSKAKLEQSQQNKEEGEILEAILRGNLGEKTDIIKKPQMVKI